MTKTNIWKNKHVLVTGHTGFKGGWLSLLLSNLGAKVYGVAIEPPSEPNFYTLTDLGSVLESDNRIDIRDFDQTKLFINSVKPELVFHLAAQPLVHDSYHFPLETYATNVMGTAHILEAIRTCESVHAAVIITSDKCYENRERTAPYMETDRLGGKDPYSNSKACAELVTASYRTSFFSDNHPPYIATARAGNVIGGGDWAKDRLIPDCIRAYCSKTPMTLRCPSAIRPWQHVLESVNGYLILAEHLLSKSGSNYAEPWNFGPEEEDMETVGEVAKKVCHLLNIPIHLPNEIPKGYEATILRLDSTKAKTRLHWHRQWPLQKTIQETVKWYLHWEKGYDMLEFTLSQIQHYLETETALETAY